MSGSLNEDQQVELFAAILPYLIPLNIAGLRLTRSILGSAFASTCTPLMPALMDVVPAQSGDGNELIFRTVCSTMQAVIVRTKPFIADQTSSKPFELIVARLHQDPSNLLILAGRFQLSGLPLHSSVLPQRQHRQRPVS